MSSQNSTEIKLEQFQFSEKNAKDSKIDAFSGKNSKYPSLASFGPIKSVDNIAKGLKI